MIPPFCASQATSARVVHVQPHYRVTYITELAVFFSHRPTAEQCSSQYTMAARLPDHTRNCAGPKCTQTSFFRVSKGDPGCTRACCYDCHMRRSRTTSFCALPHALATCKNCLCRTAKNKRISGSRRDIFNGRTEIPAHVRRSPRHVMLTLHTSHRPLRVR